MPYTNQKIIFGKCRKNEEVGWEKVQFQSAIET